MKAITLHQPWASAVAVGLKHFETRSWPAPKTIIGQPLAIHAGVKEAPDLEDAWSLNVMEPEAMCSGNFAAFDAAGIGGYDLLPRGAVVCIMRVVRCWETTQLVRTPDAMRPNELRWGDYTPGRYAWELSPIYVFDRAIPAKGAQGLWNWNIPDEWMERAANDAGMPGLFEIWKAVVK